MTKKSQPTSGLNSYALWLDDYRDVHPSFKALPGVDVVVHVRNYGEFVKAIENLGCPMYISFDHDLADNHYAGDYTGEKTGMECARWFGEWLLDDPDRLHPRFGYFVHSMNPAGAENIRCYVRNLLKALGRAV